MKYNFLTPKNLIIPHGEEMRGFIWPKHVEHKHEWRVRLKGKYKNTISKCDNETGKLRLSNLSQRGLKNVCILWKNAHINTLMWLGIYNQINEICKNGELSKTGSVSFIISRGALKPMFTTRLIRGSQVRGWGGDRTA